MYIVAAHGADRASMAIRAGGSSRLARRCAHRVSVGSSLELVERSLAVARISKPYPSWSMAQQGPSAEVSDWLVGLAYEAGAALACWPTLLATYTDMLGAQSQRRIRSPWHTKTSIGWRRSSTMS
jgi:hypothetical protein